MSKNTQITSIFHLLIHHLFIFFCSTSITQFPLASHGCHQEERKTLLDIKSSIEDPSNRLDSWQEGSKYQNCCDWHGVQCSSGSFHVISVDLRNREYEIYFNQYHTDGGTPLLPFSPPKTALQGKRFPPFYRFTHLQYLDLAFNNFQESQIPLEFSTLTKLTHLDFSKSNFSGSILRQFANLSSLKYLDLSCEPGDCINLPSTKWLKGLVNLQVLRLSGIDLHEATVTSSLNNFSDHISFLSNLENLDLSECNISGPVFPIQNLNNLSRLSSLNMSKNYELNSTFPVYLANLASLSSLSLFYCNLHGSVPYMPHLKELQVKFNTDLHVDLTRMFEHQWLDLQHLTISSTKVTGPLLNLISNVPLLEYLAASDCSFQGSIPNSICEMSFLRYLALGSNNFTGTIPRCIIMLRYLNVLSIHNNAISGDVSLYSLISKLNLTILDLSNNNLTVSTYQSLHVYPKLTLKRLMLVSCNLKGLFPTFICNLTGLEKLHLPDNSLRGTVPSCIYKLKNLMSLDLSHNNLHGPLPLPCRNAKLYKLEHNKFNGEITIEIGKRLSTVTNVSLSGNELKGSVPSSMCSIEPGLYSKVQYLELSKNKLSGIIPTSIGYCTSLVVLNLGNNNLTGSVPKEIEQAKNLRHLRLNDNNLHGDPRHFISKLNELVILELGNNSFEGSVSNLLGSLKNLWILSLRSNSFRGSIPKEIGYLDKLQILDLAGNNLTGFIPREIGNLTMLKNRSSEYLGHLQLQMRSKGIVMQYEKLHTYNSGIDLSSNKLEGEIPEEIGQLKGLAMLNLSRNRLSAAIPLSVGSMKGLESLDLSYNKLSGLIPPSLESLDYLGYLNLSYNNLSGKVPRGPHIDTLGGDGSAYANNRFLCGYLTKNACENDQSSITTSPDEDGQDDTRDKLYTYGAVALGFIVGFWGLFFGLLVKKEKWWFPYWRVIDAVAVRIVNLFLKD